MDESQTMTEGAEQRSIELPPHAEHFHFNVGLIRVGNGYTTSVSLWNYFSPEIVGTDRIWATAELEVYDAAGTLAARKRVRVAPSASLHMEIAPLLGGGNCADFGFGTAYLRLVPDEFAARAPGVSVPTEFMVEIRHASGTGEIVHNIGGRRVFPGLTQMGSGLWFSDETTFPRYVVFANNYFGPRLPLIGSGKAKLHFVNRHGEMRVLSSHTVPARGTLVIDVEAQMPDMQAYLGDWPARVEVRAANLVSKPWVWYERRKAGSSAQHRFCIDHL